VIDNIGNTVACYYSWDAAINKCIELGLSSDDIDAWSLEWLRRRNGIYDGDVNYGYGFDSPTHDYDDKDKW